MLQDSRLILSAGTLPGAKFRERVAVAQQAGFDAISLFPQQYLSAMRREKLTAGSMRDILSEHGIALDATDTKQSPWHIVPSDDKQLAHLNCISHILGQIPYEPLGTAIVTLPKPNKDEAYDDIKSMKDKRYIPQKY